LVETAVVARVSGPQNSAQTSALSILKSESETRTSTKRLNICTKLLRTRSKHRTALQAGHSEEWLCSIFANLTEDLEIALRSAWHATMIVHYQSMRQANVSLHTYMRQAFAKVIGHAADEVTDINCKQCLAIFIHANH
jgi:hypothetical protein